MTRTILLAAAVLALGGCAKGALAVGGPIAGPPAHTSSVPVEFRAACGHPGMRVTVKTAPVTVRHADCDLTGAHITYGLASADVPKPGETASMIVDTFAPTTDPTMIDVAVDGATLDVTVTGG